MALRIGSRQLAYTGGYGRVPKDGHPRYVGCYLLEELQPLTAQVAIELHETRRVSARSRQTFDEARADRVRDDSEDDRQSSGFLKQELCGAAASSQNDIRRKRDQFGRIFAKANGIPRPKTHIDLHVAAVDPAQLL